MSSPSRATSVVLTKSSKRVSRANATADADGKRNFHAVMLPSFCAAWLARGTRDFVGAGHTIFIGLSGRNVRPAAKDRKRLEAEWRKER